MIGLYLCRQRPTLPHTFACSTIGPAGLNFRVRDGNGWIPRGKITDNLEQSLVFGQLGQRRMLQTFKELENEVSQLNRLAPCTTAEADGWRYKALFRRRGALAELLTAAQVLASSQKLRAKSFHAPSKFYGQAERAISTGKLRVLLRFDILPINQVVFLGPSYPLRVGRSHLGECFPLICIQRLSQPNFATQLCHRRDSWNTRGSFIPVLSY